MSELGRGYNSSQKNVFLQNLKSRGESTAIMNLRESKGLFYVEPMCHKESQVDGADKKMTSCFKEKSLCNLHLVPHLKIKIRKQITSSILEYLDPNTPLK